MFGTDKNPITREIKYFVFRTPALSKIYYRLKKITSFSNNNYDLVLQALLPQKRGFYVECGAYDGLYESNSRIFEVKQGCTGVLIEPIPYYFFELKKNRSKKNYFFQCALVPFSHTSRNIEMVQAGAMSIATELELDIIDAEAHLATARRHLEKYQDERKLVKRILVPARTLNSILIECNSPEVIDFLSLDVEGAELDVLRGVDFNRYRFRYIVIESRNFKNTIAFMCERQYKLLKILSVSDLLFGFEENESNS